MFGGEGDFVATLTELPRSRSIVSVVQHDCESSKSLGQGGMLTSAFGFRDCRVESLHRFAEPARALVCPRAGQCVGGVVCSGDRRPVRPWECASDRHVMLSTKSRTAKSA